MALKGMDILAMAGKKPAAGPTVSDGDLDAAVKELFANPSAATFKAAMSLCEDMGDYSEPDSDSDD